MILHIEKPGEEDKELLKLTRHLIGVTIRFSQLEVVLLSNLQKLKEKDKEWSRNAW